MHDNLDFSKYKGFCQKQSLWGLISVFSDPPCYQNILQTFPNLQNLHPHAAPGFFHLLVWAGGRGQCMGQAVGCPACRFLRVAGSCLLKSYNCLFLSKVIILRLFSPNSCQLSQELWKYIFGISASLSVGLKSIQQFQCCLVGGGGRDRTGSTSHQPYEKTC